MTSLKISNKNFYNDIIWYLLGTIIPMGINVIKTPIFTRHYSTEDYGYLGLVMTIFIYFSTASYSWIVSCIWRFFHQFKNEKKLNIFYSNIVFLFLLSTILMLICSAFFIAFYHSPLLVLKLIILCFFHFTFKELLGLYFVILRIKGEAKISNLLLISQTILSFITLIILAFNYNFDISSLILSSIIIDFTFLIAIIIYNIKNLKIKQLDISLINKNYLKLFFNFGRFVIFSNLFILLIVSSDRYILALYDTIENVGIYTKVYDIAQVTITALVFVFFSTINPKMNNELANNFEKSNTFLSKYIFSYIIIILPITFISSIFSKELSEFLLGRDFQKGHIIMPYVFFSAFIYGLITFNMNKLKFANQLKKIIVILFICLAINILFNFIFIPYYGYIAAAFSTLITYSAMLILFFSVDSLSFFKEKKYIVSISKQIIILTSFLIIDHYLKANIDYSIKTIIIEITAFSIPFIYIFRKEYKILKDL